MLSHNPPKSHFKKIIKRKRTTESLPKTGTEAPHQIPPRRIQRLAPQLQLRGGEASQRAQRAWQRRCGEASRQGTGEAGAVEMPRQLEPGEMAQMW